MVRSSFAHVNEDNQRICVFHSLRKLNFKRVIKTYPVLITLTLIDQESYQMRFIQVNTYLVV
jgi:hypothetical protein